jgi:hypothetical protein
VGRKYDRSIDLFNNLANKDPGIHVELSDDAKYAMKV